MFGARRNAGGSVGSRIAALVGLLFLLPIALAHGQTTPERSDAPERPGYQQAIQQAIQEYSLGNFAEAHEQFGRAHELWPNARTFRGLGVTEFELRNYPESASYLEQALASREKPLEGTMLRETEELLARARGYVGVLLLRLTPAHVSVLIDGLQTLDPAPEKLRLNVGEHELEFLAQGYVPQRSRIKIRGGQQDTLALDLVPLVEAKTSVAGADAAFTGLASAPVPAPSEQKPLYKRPWLWAAVTIVVAGAAVGTVLALRSNDDSHYVAAPSGNTPPGLSLQPLLRY